MFFPTHIQGLDPMMPPQKKLDYDKSRRKHQNKEYNTLSKEMLTLGIGAAENKQNKVGVKLTIGRRKRFYFVVFSFTEWRGFIFSLRWVPFD